MVFALAMILPAVLPADTFAVRVEAASVKLSASKATLAVGQKYSLSVKGTKAKVTWSSGNTKVATVSNGTVKAKKEGTAVITAKVGKKKLTCKVTVKGNYKTLYKSLLTKGTVSYSDKNGKGTDKARSFALLDIDQNGVPELIVNNAETSGFFSTRYIYTVKSGKIVYCGRYYVRGENYLYYNQKYKAVYTWWWTNGVGGQGSQLFRLSGSTLSSYKYIWEGSDRPGSSKKVYYYGTSGEKNKKVSKSTYLSAAKKYFKGQKKYSFVNNTAANRKKKLG
ncbi:bacterial group 2 Ig-like protein [Marvinbryantia formatexigens DSM 14469]|uniref:Bacterial group 2 Ig-like protein n=2 Tax=Marvinbryantia TaxID=248744 RepID=C6LF24_9FIRM|nr:bacterial group 2 Ig-like protein [Marvinbryantia formatexigens DSM 14469]